MSIFKWDESMSVDIEKFDNAHKNLVSTIDELFRSMRDGQGKTKLAETISKLTQYTVTHFKEEEDAMTEYDYPELDSHRAEHEKFITQVDKFSKEYAKNPLFMTPQVLDFLKDWLVGHIMNTDALYTKHLKSKGLN